ncbi:beta-glucosidase 18-like isoform X2 [Bidens hawaiensis]|uniref:beta-glucosidase 18-like isoform X2 n=1 Tax=Bidens hawaiensis TaxID=980011 RepID=UPI00404966FA
MKMKILTISLFFFLISASASFLEASNNGYGGSIYEENEETQIRRSDFPSGFLFGTATSAYQVEGAYLDDGKSFSNWDAFCHSGGCEENGDIADDHYHMFLVSWLITVYLSISLTFIISLSFFEVLTFVIQKDIELMHFLGIQTYRFSISWARILPRGRFGEVNPAGIMFYSKIIDNLILKDLPQELEDRYGSWLNPEKQEEFIYFAEICFKSFGDQVKYWITINEPKLYAELAYELGIFPPSRCSEPFGNCLDGNSDVEPIIAMHNMLLAHGRASKLYHEYFQPKQGGSIGVTVHSCMYEPLTDSELDHQAAKRAFAFHSGWALDPSIFGGYPEELKKYLGHELPSFSPDEKSLMKNSIDFIGINHYSTSYVKDCTNSNCSATGNHAIEGFVEMVGERDGMLIGELTGQHGSYVVPRGMEEIVNLIKTRYNNTPMFITENGYSSPDVHEQRVSELTNDVKRIEYHSKYLASLAKSIRDGADVRGYFAWSFLDSYEWTNGYNTRYGLYYVDRQTLTRTPKLSVTWYKNFLADKTGLDDN